MGPVAAPRPKRFHPSPVSLARANHEGNLKSPFSREPTRTPVVGWLPWGAIAAAAVWLAVVGLQIARYRYRTWTEAFLLATCACFVVYAAMDAYGSAIRDSDAGRLLAAVLKREQPEVRQVGDIDPPRCADPKDSAHG